MVTVLIKKISTPNLTILIFSLFPFNFPSIRNFYLALSLYNTELRYLEIFVAHNQEYLLRGLFRNAQMFKAW